MEQELRRLYGRLGGLTRSLNHHLKQIEIAPPERKEYHKARIDELRDSIAKTWDNIEEFKKPKVDYVFVDIDEESGLFIYYDLDTEKYFLAPPQEPVPPKDKRLYFRTLEISVNYTFETGGGGKERTGKLAAKIRLSVRVEKMQSRQIESLMYYMNKSYKEFVADFFGWDFGTKRNYEKGLKISRAVRTEEDWSKEQFQDTVAEPIKIGAFFRLSQKAPTFVLESKYARAEIFGEWTRTETYGTRTYDWRKFSLKQWFDYLDAWEHI